ncbi:MAG: phage/plasmid primase, P4 family [Halothece sp.]
MIKPLVNYNAETTPKKEATKSKTEPTQQGNNDNPTTINKTHWEDLTCDRALPPDWAIAGFHSIDRKEASDLLHCQAKSGGLLLNSANGQQQFKPDQPWSDKQGKKAPKYRTPYKDNIDAMLPINPHDPNFWKNEETLKQACWKEDGVPCLLITEGLFKAIQGTANGLPTIALTGVENGLTGSKDDPESKRFLVDHLRKFAESEFGFIFAFDADCATNKNVIRAEKTLAAKLEKFNVPVYSITGTWSEDEGKGMDDYIQNHGIEAFREKLIQAELVREKYKNNEKDGKDNKPPLAGEIGEELAENYHDRWVYCSELSSWLVYELEEIGIWSMVSDDYISHAVLIELKSRDIHKFRSNKYMNNILGYLKDELFIRKWNEQFKRYLPFKNGVYDLDLGKFHNHSPGFRLTWKLPRDYCVFTEAKEQECNTIFMFLKQLTGDDSKNINTILAFMAAILKGKNDIQKFLYLLGSGGSGKSTLMDFITELVGGQNATNFSLEELEDKHNIIDLFDKRLLNLPDQPPISSRKNSNFKRLTGGDYLSGRRMRKDVSSFKFQGLAVLTSNQFCFPASASNWLNRRMILIECNNIISKRDRDLKLLEKMKEELPAFTSYLLHNFDDALIEELIFNPDEPELTPASWKRQCESDGLAAWINDEIIQEDSAIAIIGTNGNHWTKQDEDYDPDKSSLYASYCYYCRQSGRKPKTPQNFSTDLLEICNQLLGWDIEKKLKRYAGKPQRVIEGLRLRTERDENIPLVEHQLQGVTTYSESVTTPVTTQESHNEEIVTGVTGVTTNNNNKANQENKPSLDADYRIQNQPNEVSSFSKNTEDDQKAVTAVTPENNKAENPTKLDSQNTQEVVTPTNNSCYGVVTGCYTANNEVDFFSYPARRDDSLAHKKKQAKKCRKLLSECQDQADIEAFKENSGFSESEYKWVWNNLLTAGEKDRLRQVVKISQVPLFD